MNARTLMALLAAIALTATACGGSDNNDENNSTENNSTENNSSSNNATPEEQQMQWETCFADKKGATEYEQFEETISSIARVGAYERIADILWDNPMEPATTDFEDANLIYVEEEGLDSRVSRREDEHYPPVMKDGEVVKCRDEGVPELDPDRCVGPAKIKPLIIDSLTAGAMGEEPWINAARVDAALLWFFYVSSHKEAITCTQKKKDCDSSYAYYTGGEARDGGIGLAGQFLAHVPDAHELTWEGIQAVRCWRTVDDGDTATNIELRDQAVAILDAGLLYGFSRIVTARLAELATSDTPEVDWAWLQITGPVLDRAATERDSAKAQILRDAFAQESADGLDAMMLIMTIEELFPKPE